MKAKITVVTVCYNCVQDIERTILSVANQTYTNIEYIIIDGGSKDGTLDVINNYRDKITRFISEPDNGIYDAMNKGIRYATGEWINFMNVGDIFHSNETIEKVFSSYKDNGEVVVYGKTNVISKNTGDILFSGYSGLKYMPSHHQALFVRAKEMKGHPFDLRYKIIADANFFYNLYKRNKNQYKVEEIIVDYDNEGLSSIHARDLEKEKILMYVRHFDFLRVLDYIYTKCHNILFGGRIL